MICYKTNPTAFSKLEISYVFRAENNRRVQTEERRAVRTVEPEMDEVAAQDLLSVLLRQGLPHTQPGVPE